ncbi:MAG: MoaD/ThiS family protein [Pseudomonadota bacterium]
MITVKYFASIRETLGRDQDVLDTTSARTVGDVLIEIAGNSQPPANWLVAVNMEYVDMNHPVRDGDEVAFFPPVTGG